MRTIIERLDEVIADLDALDIDTLADDELHELTVDLQRRRSRLGAVAARSLARWDTRGAWRSDRSRGAACRLAREVRCSTRTAKLELRRARKLASMPATAEAVTAGELSLDHVDLLGRANGPGLEARFAEDEPALVEQCKQLRFADAARMIDYWRCRADADRADDDAEREREGAALFASTTLDGTVVLNGILDRIGGAAFLNELERLERAQYLVDEAAGVLRTAAQRRAAALVDMARRSAAAPVNARKPRPLFTVLLGDETFSGLCELAGGPVVTPGQLRSWFETADIETILFDGPSTVISVSQRRSFTGALRRAIELRDRHCQHPSGCDTPAADCDIDHITPWSAGGATSQFNGRLECRPHNRHADQHDADGVPSPSRPITIPDEIRGRLRWRYQRDDGDDPDADDSEVSDTG